MSIKKGVEQNNIKYGFYYPEIESVADGIVCAYRIEEDAHKEAKKLNVNNSKRITFYRIITIAVGGNVKIPKEKLIKNDEVL